MTFTLQAHCPRTGARLGHLRLRDAEARTPMFMPVGTLGLVKGLDPEDLQRLGAQVCLANAYHLMLRPGDGVVETLGGLRRFTGWSGGFLTDSGGFQVYSLSQTRKIDDTGVRFRSHIDGALVELTPERLVQVQERLRPDIAMVLDECPPANADRAQVRDAVRRTGLWAKRCLSARQRGWIVEV